jgi:HEAT repeat protein
MADEKHPAARAFDALSARSLAGKREYVRSLEERPDEEKLSLLVECLCDESWYMRELGEEAVERCGEKAVPALIGLLGQGLWYTRTSAARVLGRLGSLAAIQPLLALARDDNQTVADAARDALMAIARRGGSAALARAVYALAPERRRQHLSEFSASDRPVGERLAQLLRNEELMQAESDELLRDDHPLVRQSEEGVEWEVLTGPPPSRPAEESPGEAGGRPGPGA